jgi:NAD+ kinase
VKRIALVAKKENPAAKALAFAMLQRYSQLQFLVEPQLATEWGLPNSHSPDEMGLCDMMVVLGGDGTLIHGARLLRGKPVPILGINMGSLGFMTEIPQEEALKRLDDALSGVAQVESRMKLVCRLIRQGKVLFEDEVLNDVVFNKGALAKITDFEAFVDGQFITLYKADGVIVATPTGSTAYSLSAHGPIVHPSLDCVVMTPICPHALTQRPIVLPGSQRLSIMLKSDSEDVFLTLDGQSGHALKKGDRVEVERSNNRVFLIRNPHLDYFAILRQKLHWGER